MSFKDENGATYYEDLTLIVPESRAKPKHVTLYLYTQRNKENGVRYTMDEADKLKLSTFYDPKKPNFFVIHGWTNDYRSPVNTLIKDAILAKSDMNVFVVDWSGPAKGLYSIAKGAVPQVGKFIGEFVKKMINMFGILPSDIKMAGHSLGAHIAGCAGAEIGQKIDYIVGLDPASPLFTVKNKAVRLDESDANFVQVIHTSTNFLGFKSSLGHVDIFPNKGYSQPGCGLNMLYICSHGRSYEFYAESILSGGFASQKCKNYKTFNAGQCENNDMTYMGGLELDTR